MTFNIQYLTPKLVDEFLKLDEKVYNEKYRVTKETTLNRLSKNPYTDIIITDKEKMVGYLSLCPIDKTIEKKIIQSNISEEEIEDKILPFDKMGFYNVYLSSIVIDKENYPHVTGKMLFEQLEVHLKNLRREGIFISNIIAVAVSIAGRKSLLRMKFREIHDNVFLFSCKKQGIKFVATHIKHAFVFVSPTPIYKDISLVTPTMIINEWYWDTDT